MALSGQQEPRPVFRAGTELVEVDVTVLDKQQRPVRGLKPEDFTVVDRKRQQVISHFSEIAHERKAPAGPMPPPDVRQDVADNSAPSASRVVLLVIDDITTWRERVEIVKRVGHRFVDGVESEASLAVLFTSGRHSTEVTADQAVVHAAIDTLQGQKWEFARSPNEFQRLTLWRTIRDAAAHLGSERARRRAIVLIGEGVHADVRGLFEYMQLRPPPGGVQDVKERVGVNRDDMELLNMMEALRRANCLFYAIDPRGRIETFEERNQETRGGAGDLLTFDSVYQSQEALRLTAAAAGGFAITNTDDLQSGVDRLVADLDNYYVLGFYPDNPSDKSWHNLEVTVNRPDVIVRHRRGYRLNSAPPPPKNQDPLVALSAGVLPKTDLPLRVFATPTVMTDREATVGVTVEVQPPPDAVLGPQLMADSLTITVLAVDLKKKKVTRSVTRDVASTAHQFPLQMVLPPGQYQLRTSVISSRFEKAGSAYLLLDVPALPKQGPVIAGMLIGVRGAQDPMVTSSDGRSFPFLPVLDRVFERASVLRVAFWVAMKNQTGPMPSRVEIVDTSGTALVRADAPLTPVGSPATVELPLSGVSPGPYRARVTVSGPDGSTTREVGIAVR